MRKEFFFSKNLDNRLGLFSIKVKDYITKTQLLGSNEKKLSNAIFDSCKSYYCHAVMLIKIACSNENNL